MPRRGDHEIERLLAAERAAQLAGDTAAEWWQEIATTAAVARSDRALNTLFRTALITLKEMLGADALAVLVANETGDELVARAATGLSEEVALGLGIRAGQGMTGQVIARRKPLVVRDLGQIDVATDTLRNSGLRSVVAVPMLFEDRLLGVLYAGSRHLGHFAEVDADLLEIIAARLASALERVRAFEAERAARLRAQRDADRLARLQDFTAKLVAESNPAEIAAVLGEALAVDSVGRDVASSVIWLVRDDRLELAYATPDVLIDPPEEVALTSEAPLARATADRQAMYLRGADGDPFGRAGANDHSSWAILPLVVRDESVSVAAVAYPGAMGIEFDERVFLGSMAGLAAQAMHRSRLHEQELALAQMASFFAQAARVIAEAADFADTLGRLAELALVALGDICLIDVVGEDGRPRRMVARHRDPDRQHLVDRLGEDYPPEADGAHPAMEVIHTGRTRWSGVMSEEFLRATTRDEAHFSLVRQLEFRSYLSVPLVADTTTLGALTLVSGSRAFGPEDVRFAERLAEQVAAVVDNARRYEATLRTSHVLQQSLLPQRLPEVPGLQIATRYLPATRGLDVGGDFYDLVVLPNGNTSFVVGDVEGHDRDAAALMGHLRSAARVLAGQFETPSQVIAALQQSWQLLDFDRIATGVFGSLAPAAGELVLASAGHYPPLLVGPEAAHFVPVRPGTPLGLAGTAVTDWRGRLEPGQVLLLYTDGAIDERVLGAEASMEHLASGTAGVVDPAAVCERVVELLPSDRADDVALLALGLRG